jgi:DNA polymerase-1
MKHRTIALIDGNSLLYRAFFALPASIATSDGRPTNAVYGFTSMLLRLMREEKPDAIAVAFDMPGKTFRHEAYEHYKAQRPKTPDELASQIPIATALLEAMAIPVITKEGYEADDVLGTLAKRAAEHGDEVMLVTADRDAFQLVGPHVRIWTTRKGISDIVIYDREKVIERYGIPPERVPDFIGLKGDSSDNIPGVPGVGEKTAAELLGQFDTVEDMYARLDEVKSDKLRAKLAAAKEEALLSKQLATIDTDAPVDVDLDACAVGGWDLAEVEATFRDLQFKTLLERFLAEQGAGGPEAPQRSGAAGKRAIEAAFGRAAAPARAREDIVEPPAGPAPTPEAETTPAAERPTPEALQTDALVSLIAEAGTLAVALAESANEGMLALDGEVETASALAVASAGRTATADAAASIRAARTAIAARLADGALTLVGHDLKELWRDELAAARPAEAGEAPAAFDTAIASYLLDPGRSSYPIDELAWTFLGRRYPEAPAGAPAVRAAEEARTVFELEPPLRARLEADGLSRCMETVEMPLLGVLARTEMAGVGLDQEKLARLDSELTAEIATLQAGVYASAEGEFNLNSPKQLGEVLFERLGLPKGKKTKTGYSTDAATLGKLACDFPVVDDILRYRELTKLKNTYVDALPKIVGGDGRLHTSLKQTVAATGRLSSVNPNLQNIPVRTDLGKRIREAFVPTRPGDLLMVADYSQIELRILAHLSGDDALAKAFEKGLDIHTATACEVFGVEPGEVTGDLRRKAKAVNFGLVYGQSAHGLAESLGISREEAESYITLYFSRYPGVQAFIQAVIGQGFRDGYVTTISGRRRYVPELKSGNFQTRTLGERVAVNSPIQGSAADVIKLAMIAIDRCLASEGLETKMVLQVHDELVFELPAGEKDACAALVKREMEGAFPLSVPLTVDVGFGPNWGDAK